MAEGVVDIEDILEDDDDDVLVDLPLLHDMADQGQNPAGPAAAAAAAAAAAQGQPVDPQQVQPQAPQAQPQPNVQPQPQVVPPGGLLPGAAQPPPQQQAVPPVGLPPGAVVQLTDAQLQRYLGAGGNAHRAAVLKLDTYDQLDPESWRNFRVRCNVARRRNHWDEQSAKEMVFGAIIGKAASRISHVEIGGDPAIVPLPDDAKTYEDFMVELQACFHHVEASALARSVFQSARQKAGENVQEWHSRARILYKEAWPLRDWDTSEELIQRFNHGLIDEPLAVFLADQNPQTYAACLTLVHAKQGRMAQVKAGRSHRGNYSMNAMGDFSNQTELSANDYAELSFYRSANDATLNAINDHRGGMLAPTSRSANAFLRSRGPGMYGSDNRSYPAQNNFRRPRPSCTECNLDGHPTSECPSLAAMPGRGRRGQMRGGRRRAPRGGRRPPPGGRPPARAGGNRRPGRGRVNRPRNGRLREMNAIDGADESNHDAVDALGDILSSVRLEKGN